MITKDNFWVASQGRFSLVDKPNREPDYISYYNGQVSSEYWFSPFGVYRRSQHWGSVLHCQWSLDLLPGSMTYTDGPNGAHGDWIMDGNEYVFVTGVCPWQSMKWVSRDLLKAALEWFRENDNTLAFDILQKLLR